MNDEQAQQLLKEVRRIRQDVHSLWVWVAVLVMLIVGSAAAGLLWALLSNREI